VNLILDIALTINPNLNSNHGADVRFRWVRWVDVRGGQMSRHVVGRDGAASNEQALRRRW